MKRLSLADLAETIKSNRIEKGITQEQLCKKTGINRNMIGRIERMDYIPTIPQLEKLVATIRSREISACLVLQARSQLKAIYKDNADTIVGNMDSQIFLGGSEPTTLKALTEMLG